MVFSSLLLCRIQNTPTLAGDQHHPGRQAGQVVGLCGQVRHPGGSGGPPAGVDGQGKCFFFPPLFVAHVVLAMYSPSSLSLSLRWMQSIMDKNHDWYNPGQMDSLLNILLWYVVRTFSLFFVFS